MRYLVLICLLGLFVGCQNQEEARRIKQEARLAKWDVKHTETFKANVSSAYKHFSEGIAENNHIRLIISSRLLSGMNIPDCVKDHSDRDVEKSIERLANTVNKFADTLLNLSKDKVRREAGMAPVTSEEEVESGIKDIKNSFKKLDEAFDLGLKL